RGPPGPGGRGGGVPNWGRVAGAAPPPPTAKVIAAAGRLVPGKRYDVLLEAFCAVAAKAPDWELRIYGGGAEKERLQGLIDGLGLGGRARLMGVRTPIEAEFARASLVVSASDAESFGMTLVEAMRCGVPVVSTDCPLGPAEIITDRVDGRLVPVRDARALADAMLDLVLDDELRRSMGAAARASAHRYDPEPIVDHYERLFAELRAARPGRAWSRQRERARGWARRTLRGARRRLRAWGGGRRPELTAARTRTARET
ncbi:glycosyltransferase, partial [Streptomyces avermitilis]|uniref:glycosyltransferase n=1 Tax=Streptomyces avermitilis TaxID=33903 RepID=UPI003F4D5B3A